MKQSSKSSCQGSHPYAEDSQKSSAEGQTDFDLGTVESSTKRSITAGSHPADAGHDRRAPPQRTLCFSLEVLRRPEHVVDHRNDLPKEDSPLRQGRKMR